MQNICPFEASKTPKPREKERERKQSNCQWCKLLRNQSSEMLICFWNSDSYFKHYI